jgi:hypothetical protein
MTAIRDERSLGELFGELSQQTSMLVKKEIELARHEITRSAGTMARDAAFVGAGAALAYAGLIVLLIGVGWLLASIGLPEWLAFLIVGAVAVAIGTFVAWRYARELQQVRAVPERTIETVKEDVEWAKDQTK